jgi:hypothetical protein
MERGWRVLVSSFVSAFVDADVSQRLRARTARALVGY